MGVADERLQENPSRVLRRGVGHRRGYFIITLFITDSNTLLGYLNDLNALTIFTKDTSASWACG